MLTGTKCDCTKQRHREYDRLSRNRKSAAFYKSSKWHRARDRALELDGGLDVWLYMTEGKVVAADTVHHIVQLKDDWSKALDISNLMSLHHDTHSMIESMYRQDKEAMIKKLQKMLKEYRTKSGGRGD
jgi:hypothetical protein